MSVRTRHPPSHIEIIGTAGGLIDAPQLKSAKSTKLSAVFAYMLAIEFIAVAASTYFGNTSYHYAFFEVTPSPNEYLGEAFFIAATFTIISLGFRHFGMARRQQLHMLLWSGIGAVALAFAIFVSTIFLLKISVDFSRGALIFQIIGASSAICISRALFLWWLRSAVASGNIEARRAILIGDTGDCSKVANEMKTGGIHIVAAFSLPRDCKTGNDRCSELSFSQDANVRKMADLCRTMLPDDIVVLSEKNDLLLASDLAHYLSELPCNIYVAPLESIRFLTRSQIADLGSVKALHVSKRPLSLIDLAVKRAFDIVVATIALIALSPLMLTVALAIKMSTGGNVLFRQSRHGYNNKVIRVFKFRTMIETDNSNGEFKPTTENDFRITILGRILRQTNIDELPQLLNVLLGEMSIVGPRPHATNHNKMFENKIMPFARRHNMKPGITGWAQVNGYRGPADTVEKMQQRVEYDLYYIDNWSFFFDLKIMLMTFFTRKAYKNAF